MTFADALEVDFGDNLSLRRVWLAIAARVSRETGFATASIDQLEADTGLSRSTVQRNISELEFRGNLEIERGNGRGSRTRFRPKGCQKGVKRVSGFSQGNQRMAGALPYSDEKHTSRDTLSPERGSCKEMTKRAVVILRRRNVRDGYNTLLGAMNDGEFITAPGLAKHLGMNPTTVRNDLMALFKSLDIPLEAQFRYRKSKGKPWHKGKMSGDVVPFYAHGRGRS